MPFSPESVDSDLAYGVQDCPQQNNDFDCGVFILVAALHIVADRPFPDCIDGSTWRFIFRAALDVSFSLPSAHIPLPSGLASALEVSLTRTSVAKMEA